MLEEWGYTSSSHQCYVLYAGPVSSRAASDGPVLESVRHLDPGVKPRLRGKGHLAVLKRGTRAAACKGSCRLAKLQTCKTKEN